MTSPNMDSEGQATPVGGKGSTPSETPQNGSNATKKSQEKVPKRVHKAEREKLKREHLNDLFLSLANALELSEQANGKATILNETVRRVKDLLAEIVHLKKENAALLSESEYMSMETKELEDENSVLEAEISELQSKLVSQIKEIKERTTGSNLDLNLAPPGCEQEVIAPDYFSLPANQPASQTAETMMNPVYVYPFRPEPRAYPAPALPASTVSKPLARYPTPTDAWSSQILGKRPRLEKETQGGGSN
ncbi:PREDICTED: transcription factor bHLH47-like [Ipomoea nil]|uniref:transcription factor bHLH47-like n=1 Tax=Ipomoea nil TaxID=35883 RepID=UPI0009017A7B|nr:PREDICTED: transcription factor bHLH47-like [Ipomoea nil]